MNIEQTYSLLLPKLVNSFLRIEKDNTKFVHYCTAESAALILKNKCVWMRNSSVMNDFSEVSYGFECVKEAIKKYENRLKVACNSCHSGVYEEIIDHFSDRLQYFRNGTFITCFSEHCTSENMLGRLSMWRAYGGQAGIALVMNNDVFRSESDALAAYTSPVSYLTIEEFVDDFNTVVTNIENNNSYLKSVPRREFSYIMYLMLKFSVLCTKHKGFFEEKEWRVIHTPVDGISENLRSSIVSIRGTPQKIVEIPLKNIPEEKIFGCEVRELIDRIIIGPCDFPLTVYDAFVRLLEDNGFNTQEASDKIYVSNIPLRRG